jgi:Dicarboxylate transport
MGFLKWTVTSSIFLLLGLLVVFAVFRISAVEFAGKAGLHFLGFDNVTLVVDQITHNEIHIQKLSLGNTVQVKGLSAQYSFGGLFKGKIDELEIETLTADLSDPQHETVSKLLRLTNRQDDETGDGGFLKLPSITLKHGQFIANTKDKRLQADVNAVLSPTLILTGNIILEGRVQSTAGDILLEKLEASFRSDIKAQTADLVIGGGLLRHDNDIPDWAPLFIYGSAELLDEEATFDINVQTEIGQSLMRALGAYDIAEQRGSARMEIQSLALNQQGLQLTDLTHYAKTVPPFNGILSMQADVTLDESRLAYEVNLDMSEFELEQNNLNITAPKIPLFLRGTHLFETDFQETEIAITNTQINIGHGDKKYGLNKLNALLSISDLGKIIELKSINGFAEHRAVDPDFIPLNFQISGGGSLNGNFLFEGDIADEKKRLMLHITARQSLNTGEGSVSLDLLPIKFGNEGLKLTKVSSLLKIIPTEVTGIISGNALLSFSPEVGIALTSAAADLSKVQYQKNDVKIKDLSLNVSAKQQNIEKVIVGKMKGRIGQVGLERQTIAVTDLSADFQVPIKQGNTFGAFNVTLNALRIKPIEDTSFKETLVAIGSAQLENEKLEFQAEISSALLGTFAKTKGLHSLDSSIGSAEIDISHLSFAKGGLQPSDLVTIIDPVLSVSGNIESDITVHWSNSDVKTVATISFMDISTKFESYSISRLNGFVRIDNLFPLTIRNTQDLVADAAFVGVPLLEPKIRFRVISKNDLPILYVDQMTMGIAGGTATINDAVLDTNSAVNRVTIHLSSLDLEDVMALGEIEDLSATGSISGHIPLIFDGDNVFVETGLLEADGSGVLKMKSKAARQALAGGGEQTKLLFDILENFRYSDLSIKVQKRATGEDTVTLHTKGGNPDVENNRPVVLNINLTTNLDKIFNTLLEGYRLSEKALRASVNY